MLCFTARFDGLSIKHSTRKRAIEILTLRNQEAILQEKRQKSLIQGLDLGNDLKLTGIYDNNSNKNKHASNKHKY